jgi:hypothetical protein
MICMLFVSIWYTIDQAQDGIPLCSWVWPQYKMTDWLFWVGRGFSVKKAAFNQFFSLHFVLPFLLAAVAVAHIIALHQQEASDPLGFSSNADKIPMHPYCLFKDLVANFIFIPVLALFVYYMPSLLGHSDDYILANPMQTPRSISSSCLTIAKVTNSAQFTTKTYCSNNSNCQLLCIDCSMSYRLFYRKDLSVAQININSCKSSTSWASVTCTSV